jgi:hypothetical protein
MNLNDLHRRLLQDVLEIGNAFPLVITGGYAVQAHRIVDRFGRDIDMATDSMVTMDSIVTTVVDGLTGRGWRVEVIGVDPHGARMMTTDDGTDWYDDQAFAEYGLTDQEISDLRRWAQSWSDDINRRLYAETYVDGDDGIP